MTTSEQHIVNIRDWCKNDFELVNQLRMNTDECHRSQFGESHKSIKEFFPNAQTIDITYLRRRRPLRVDGPAESGLEGARAEGTGAIAAPTRPGPGDFRLERL